MTTIITRLYPDTATARAVATGLVAGGHAAGTIDVIARDGAADVTSRLLDARVDPDAAARYAPAVQNGSTLLVVRAPFAPMGAARHAMKLVDRTPSIKVGVADENAYIREQPVLHYRDNLLRGNPLVMTNPHRNLPHGHILGNNPVLPPRTSRSVIHGGKIMSRMFWPMRLVSAEAKRGTSVIRGKWLVSSLFDIPTILR